MSENQATPEGILVSVSRSIRASAEIVYDAWIHPEVIGRWMFGKEVRDESIVSLTLEPSVGGNFSFVVDRGGQRLDHCGRYLELDRPRLLRFTWGIRSATTDESEVIVKILGSGSTCLLTVMHRLHPAWNDFAERTKAGWTTMLEHLARVVEEEE